MLRTIFIVMLIPLFLSQLNADQPQQPNVVLILADDLGYGELGCYGQEKIKTPHIDNLARRGVRFTQHYAGAPVCAPSRCVLMTGQSLATAEIRGNKDSGNGRIYPGQWPLADGTVTLAEIMQQSGYATGAFGKWGLGPTHSSGAPLKQGFDRFFGYNCQRNAHSYFPPFLDSDNHEQSINSFPIPGHFRKPAGEILAADYRAKNYAPDLILAESIKWLDAHHDEPFFLYLPLVEPHVAMQPPQVWLDQYPKSWDEEHGPYRGQNGYLPHPRPRAAYAAMISDLDEHVGTVMKRLDDLGLTENTIVIFTSDNGPTHCGRDKRFDIGGAAATFFNSTADLRGRKGSCYEGGLRVPCIVSWPSHIPPDTESDCISYFADWLPTLCQLTGSKVPDSQPINGIDLSSVFLQQTNPERSQPLAWEFNGYGGIVAIRDGKWKSIRRNLKRDPANSQWELYDLETDPTESTNLANQHPDIVKQMEQSYLETRTAEPDFPLPIYDRR